MQNFNIIYSVFYRNFNIYTFFREFPENSLNKT